MAAKKTNGDAPVRESSRRAPPQGASGEIAEPSAQTPGESTGRPPFRVVGVGASAGGLEALTAFLEPIRADIGMAFAVISHLDPAHKSALAEILTRVTPLAVSEAEDGMPVAPNHVYVIPPNRNMIIENGTLRLTRRGEIPGPHMPIDSFLSALAKDCAERAVGVILSGTGTDGTVGVKAIKEAGGLTFAQDESARYSAMPHSAATTGGADAVLAPAQIAAELIRISAALPVSQAPHIEAPASTNEDPAFLEILGLLCDRTGVDFLHYKYSTLLRRIERRMVLQRLTTLSDYLQRLSMDGAEVQRLFDEVLIPVTGFFRDPAVFDTLKSLIIPQLLSGRPLKNAFRVWVPGCSTGEEAYSIAICILEGMASTGITVPVKIFATDISERAISVARVGAYGEGITAEVSPQRIQRFFRKTDFGFQVSKTIRDLCIFARQDLTRDPPFSQLDLISCRNVLIYMGPELRKRVLPIMHYALKPGGVLLLGTSEAVTGFSDLFESFDKKNRFFVRASGPSREAFDYVQGRVGARPIDIEAVQERPPTVPSDVVRDADRILLARFAPSGVVVDESLKIVQFRGDTGSYLKPPSGPPTTQLMMMAREGLLGGLREALERARRDNTSARKENVRIKSNDHYQDVDIDVIPIVDSVSNARHFVILFAISRGTDEPLTSVSRPAQPPAAQAEAEKDQEIRRLSEELASTRGFLQSVIEQQEAANEELRAANEEVICANEELQSTNEEISTGQEELQATNEELSTVNDELQSRIRTANQLGDDLLNFIESTRIPIVVLGTDLCVRRFTPTAQEVMNLRPGDIGRPLSDLNMKVDLPDLEQLVRRTVDTLAIQQREVVDESGRWLKLYIRPYRSSDHKVDGVVIMLFDIDSLKRREQEIQESRDYAVGIVETVREPLLVLDGTLRVRTANRAFYQNFQVSPGDTKGRLIYEMGNGEWNIPQLRSLLEDLLPKNAHFENFEVEHDFPKVGMRTMLLNGHRVVQGTAANDQLILLAIEDITIRKRAERLRLETEDRLRALVDGAIDSIITMDEYGIINAINAATERMFGYTAAELIGQNVKTLLSGPYRGNDDGHLAHYLAKGAKQEPGVGWEVLCQRKDGSLFPVDLAISEFSDRGQRMFSGVLRDQTARKQLEQEVLETAALEQQRIGQELHDTSAQELTALGLLADSLVAIVKQESPAASNIANKMAEGLRRVLGQVRAFSRGLIRVEIDERGLMAALTELAAETTGLHGIKCTFECERPVIFANNQTARQLFLIAREAVTNALKHADARNITIALESRDGSLSLRVTDDGVGLPPEPITTKGLGLKIMRYRAGLINAHLAIDSATPKGAMITCTLSREAQDGDGQSQQR